MEKEIILPFESEAFKTAWGLWINYRKELKKPLKTKFSQQKQLKFLSTYSEEEAIMVIHQSMHFEWIGLFQLKDSYKIIYNQEHGIKQESKQFTGGDNGKELLKQSVLNKYFQ